MKMNKVVTITGHKNCGKEFVVLDLIKNDGVEFVKPYTDRELPPNAEDIHIESFNYVLPTVMDDMLRDEEALFETTINGHRYAVFSFQMIHPVNIIFADDYEVVSAKEHYPNVYTVRIVSENETQSDRVGEYLYQHEFDFVLDYDKEPVEILRDMIL